jgi:HlyD family secretion protein
VTYPVWITVPNPDLKLRPSMTANLTIVVSTAEDVLRVPNAALRFRPTAAVYAALGLTPPPEDQARRVVEAGAAGDAPASAIVQPKVDPNAHRIDELWAPLKTVETTADVWTWDADRKELKPVRLHLGGTDGAFTQVLSGDLSVGDMVVTSVVLPTPTGTGSTMNPLLNPRGASGGYRGAGGGRGGN